MNRHKYHSFLTFSLLILSLLLNIITPNIIFSYGELQDNSVITINITEDNVVIGYVKVRVLNIDNYPYNILIDIVLDREAIIRLTDSKNPSSILVFRMQYYVNNRTGTPSYIEKYYDYYPLGLYLSSMVSADILDHIFISNITLDYAFIGNETIGGTIDIYRYMLQYNLKTDFIKDLEHYALSFYRIVNDPGWFTYKIFSGGRYIGRMEVAASQVFSNTSDLRIYLEIFDREYIDLLNISVSVYGTPDSNVRSKFSRDFLLNPGEDIILPKELGLDARTITLDTVIIKFGIRGYSKILNLTKDLGVVTLSPQREYIAFPLQASLLSYKDIGNGWIEATIGITGDIDRSELSLRYIPSTGGDPIVIRCFLVSDINYSYLLYTYFVFPQPGTYNGYLIISDGYRRANLSVNFRLTGPPEEILVRPIKDKYTVLNLDQYLYLEINRLERVVRMGLVSSGKEMKYLEKILYLKSKLSRPGNKNTYVLYIPVNNSLSFSEYYEIILIYDIKAYEITRPIIITINPVYEDLSWQLEAGSGDSIFPMVNGSTYGKFSIGPWVKNIRNELYLTLFNPYSPDLYRNAPNLLGFEIYFYNVADIKISNIEINYVDISEPSESPHMTELLAGEVHKEFNILDMLLSNYLILIILTAIIVLSITIVIIMRRKA